VVPLIAQRRPAGRTLAMGIGLVCTVTLDFVLVPAQGGFGAALASTLSYTVVGAVVAVIFARTLDAGGHDLIPRPRICSPSPVGSPIGFTQE
jgi:Na+-driven multidrug efflux pump